jgi:hypothetical protein
VAQLHFPSKRDLWLEIVLWIAAVALAYASIDIARSPTPAAFKALFLVICVPSAILLPWILYGTSYALTQEALLIRCGPFRYRAPVRAIQEVVPSRNPLSSPACSLDRLHIKFEGSRFGILISPVEKRSFLQELVRVNPNLSLQGDSVLRRA